MNATMTRAPGAANEVSMPIAPPARSSSVLAEARSSLARGDVAATIRMVSEHLQTHPQDTSAHLLLADAYKYSHYKLYVPGTTRIYSYLESRGGLFDETMFYGLQYFLKEYLEGQAFTKENIDEADELLNGVFGRKGVFDRANFDYILRQHGGRLPVRIKAVPEGSAIPVKNVIASRWRSCRSSLSGVSEQCPS